MATAKSQRIGIWGIVIVLTAGTMLSFFAIILGNSNTASEKAKIDTLTKEYQDKVAAQTKELSGKYYETFNQYSSEVASFDAASITGVEMTDLQLGDGVDITADSCYTAYYIGWNPSGKIFDSSISNGSLKDPLAIKPTSASTCSGTTVITGWSEGVLGMKVNGIRQIAMPSDKAYGATGSGADIPPNTPLKFIVMIIPTPPTVEVPQELIDYYKKQGY